jgi:hypothetical protein
VIPDWTICTSSLKTLHLTNQCPIGEQKEHDMKALYEFFKALFGRVPPAVTDEHCPYCHGLGYDYSGLVCTCLREKL